MTKLLYLIGAFLLLYSCKQEIIQENITLQYLPNINVLKKGIAYKYYIHYNPIDKGESISTNISYIIYTLLPNNILQKDKYSAGFNLTSRINLDLSDDNQLKIIDRFDTFKEENIYSVISDDIFIDWAGDTTKYGFNVAYNEKYSKKQSLKQMSVIDTIINESPAKIISKELTLQHMPSTVDTTTYKSHNKDYYVKNLGLYYRLQKDKKGLSIWELVEQMDLTEFKNRADHGMKRKAYINPDKSLDNNPDFKICYTESEIGDYYNCRNNAKLKGGKGSWWRVINKKFNKNNINQESGYLTYRFIVNCKGEIGRIMTEQADLDFQAKEFNQEAIDHLYEIITSQKEWQPCSYKEETFDTYAYVTFKLRDGEVIEILP